MWNDRFSCTDHKQMFIVIIKATSPELLRSQDLDQFLRPIKGVKIITLTKSNTVLNVFLSYF